MGEKASPNDPSTRRKKPLTWNSWGVVNEKMEVTGSWLTPYFRNLRNPYFYCLQGLAVGSGPKFVTHYFVLNHVKIYIDLQRSLITSMISRSVTTNH